MKPESCTETYSTYPIVFWLTNFISTLELFTKSIFVVELIKVFGLPQVDDDNDNDDDDDDDCEGNCWDTFSLKRKKSRVLFLTTHWHFSIGEVKSYLIAEMKDSKWEQSKRRANSDRTVIDIMNMLRTGFSPKKLIPGIARISWPVVNPIKHFTFVNYLRL